MDKNMRKIRAKHSIEAAKRRKLQHELKEKVLELEQAKQTVEFIEERIEELENRDLEDVNLTPAELEEYKDC